jgi:hypothetical protein
MYIYSGIQHELSEIEMNEAKRAATAPAANRTGQTRAEHEKQHADRYKNAVQNAPAIASSQKRLAETEKLMNSK